ncbi:facilitated trehalose transporter Tret1-like [Diaphorina citri]|uniref:Facilitated trehalose transporter Tret1-like n=1 Tax=Diaphorina citri TaxID=121845 RepID=A0A3Q0JN22_DIACI|nr:facilitated trehalose transporter Tret1-like [Diaphorina citri]
MGTILGWTSPAGDRLIAGEYPFPVTESDLSFIGSSMALGAVFGSPVVGNLVDTVGRKNTMLLLAVPTLVGWGLIIWSQSVSRHGSIH